MLHYDRIDVSVVKKVNKTRASNDFLLLLVY